MSVYNDVIITPYMRQRGWIPGEAARGGLASSQGGGGADPTQDGGGPGRIGSESDLSDGRPLLTDAEPPATEQLGTGEREGGDVVA